LPGDCPSGGRRPGPAEARRLHGAFGAVQPSSTGSAPDREDVAVATHVLAREAREERRVDRAPWAPSRLPAGRGGGAAGVVRRDPAPDRPLARTARGGGLTGASDGMDEVEGEAMRRRCISDIDRRTARLWRLTRPKCRYQAGSFGRPRAPGVRNTTDKVLILWVGLHGQRRHLGNVGLIESAGGAIACML
jgi:hypothetical protein